MVPLLMRVPKTQGIQILSFNDIITQKKDSNPRPKIEKQQGLFILAVHLEVH